MAFKMTREVTRIEEVDVTTDMVVEALKALDNTYGPWPHTKVWDDADWKVVARTFLEVLDK